MFNLGKLIGYRGNDPVPLCFNLGKGISPEDIRGDLESKGIVVGQFGEYAQGTLRMLNATASKRIYEKTFKTKLKLDKHTTEWTGARHYRSTIEETIPKFLEGKVESVHISGVS